MIIFKILGIIIVLAIIFRIENFRNWIDRSLLSKEIYLFSSIDESPESQSYKIEKILKVMYFSVFTDDVNGNSLILSYQENREYQHTLWKVNKEGAVLDSIEGHGSLYSSGVYFYDDYCIDWAITGDKEAKYYDTVINYDSLSVEDFTSLLSKASIVDFKKDYGYTDYNDESRSIPPKGRCFIKIKEKWLVVESQKMFEEISDGFNQNYYSMKNKELKNKGANRLIELRPLDLGNKYYDSVFNRVGFVRRNYYHPKFFHISWNPASTSSSTSGWNGTGYYFFKYKSENINFKLPIFQETSLFGYKVESYDSRTGTYYKDDDISGDKLLFIVTNFYSHSSCNEIYVVKKK